MANARTEFVAALLDATGGAETSEATARLRAALLTFGSETPDNERCAAGVQVSDVAQGAGPSTPVITVGLDRVPLADLLNVAEGCAVPADVQDRFPFLAQGEWDIALRLVTLIITALHTAPAEVPE